jgi:hypothetical protein
MITCEEYKLITHNLSPVEAPTALIVEILVHGNQCQHCREYLSQRGAQHRLQMPPEEYEEGKKKVLARYNKMKEELGLDQS